MILSHVLICLDILVQTSKSESFPNIVAEAMLSGAAVVATNVGQTSRIVGDCGIIVPPDDIEATVTALEAVASQRILRENYMRSGPRRIRENFSISNSVEKHLTIFSEIC